MIPEKPSRKKSSSIVFSIAMILVAGIMTAGFFISREGQTEQFGSGIESSIAINQTGYLPQADKFGILADAQTGFLEWQLINTSTSEILCSGQTSDVIEDSASRQTIVIADFSDCDTPGDYVLQINDQSSPSFFISPDIYEQLPIDALRYYYLNRSGIELEAPFAGEYARPAGHLSDNDVTCEGCAYTLDVSGGWYDAGDYNKYIVSAGISVWTLLNAYELMPDVYPDNSINIPESDNGIPDILDEARWELEFMMKMQIPPGYPDAGLVHHMIRTIEPGAIGV
ncbi:MAG: glycoside hydrolase family 9 protein, partial [Aggregatilineales bacterium]